MFAEDIDQEGTVVDSKVLDKRRNLWYLLHLNGSTVLGKTNLTVAPLAVICVIFRYRFRWNCSPGSTWSRLDLGRRLPQPALAILAGKSDLS